MRIWRANDDMIRPVVVDVRCVDRYSYMLRAGFAALKYYHAHCVYFDDSHGYRIYPDFTHFETEALAWKHLRDRTEDVLHAAINNARQAKLKAIELHRQKQENYRAWLSTHSSSPSPSPSCASSSGEDQGSSQT